ncbi:MAG: DUF3231 family protein, partial [Halanaerobium sp.]|nr:DUF3231 family protein [Halanaerobium sp.]
MDVSTVIDLFKKSTEKPGLASIEAFNIWNILRGRYHSVEMFRFFLNFIHDRDFAALVLDLLKDNEADGKKLEDEAKKYKVPTPGRPPARFSVKGNIPQVNDSFIYDIVYIDMTNEQFALTRAVQTSTFNDPVREMMVELLKRNILSVTDLLKYGKLKGWVDITPAFKVNENTKVEEISASEANHIWDHLNLRYDQLYLTKAFQEYIHDADFKEILDFGNTLLSKQLQDLEGLAAKFAVSLPERPPAVQEEVYDPEMITDRFAFRMIFKGVQDALELHTRSVIQSIRNDS